MKSTTGRPPGEPAGWWLLPEQSRSSRQVVRPDLATQTKTLDQLKVTIAILLTEIVQQLTTLVYHPDKTTTGMVILIVDLEVILQLVDVGAQQCNLHFRGTSVTFSLLIIFNDLCFLIGRQCHNSPQCLRCCLIRPNRASLQPG